MPESTLLSVPSASTLLQIAVCSYLKAGKTSLDPSLCFSPINTTSEVVFTKQPDRVLSRPLCGLPLLLD